jgi:hypothetical protein
LQRTALYTNSSRNTAAELAAAEQRIASFTAELALLDRVRLRPNWPFWTGSPNRSSNPLSRIGAHPKTWQLTVGGGWLTGLPPRVFFESGKTLSDLGRTGAIICDRDHICAPATPRLTGRVSRSRRGYGGLPRPGPALGEEQVPTYRWLTGLSSRLRACPQDPPSSLPTTLVPE